MKHWFREACRLTPAVVLMLCAILWPLAAWRHIHVRGLLWVDRYLLFASSQEESLRIVFNLDGRIFPSRATIPYMRIWTFSGNLPEFQEAWVHRGYLADPSDALAGDGWLRGHPPPHSMEIAGLVLRIGDKSTYLTGVALDQQAVVEIPWWMLISIPSLILATQLYAWTRRHRRGIYMPGHCTQCGFDLRASAERCPECGLTIKGRYLAPSTDMLTEAAWKSIRTVCFRIDRHVIELSALAAIAMLLIAWELRPEMAVVAPAQWSQLPAKLRDLTPQDTTSGAVFTVCYNIRDLTGSKPLEADIVGHRFVAPGESVNIGSSSITAALTMADHRQLIEIINSHRGGKP